MTTDNSLDEASDDQQAAQDAQPHADVQAPVDETPSSEGITPDLIKQALASSDQDKARGLRATILQASEQKPDEVAAALPLAAQTGLPVQTVMRNKQTIAAQNAVTPDMVESLIKNNPQTASFLSDMDNASVSHDDIPNLKQIEDTSIASRVTDKAFLSWTDMANALEYHFAASTLETLAGSGNADSPAGRMAQTAMAQRRNDLQTSADLSASLTPNFEGRPLAKFLYSTVQGTADFAPEMALGAINPILAASAFGGGGFLSESADVLERGGTEKQANAAGLGVGTINAVAGPVLGPVFGALLSKSPLPEWAVNTLVHGAIPMTAMGVGQKAVDTGADPNKTWGQFLKELPATAGESALQGILFHALSAGYGKAKEATLGRFGSKVQDALKAEQIAPVLQRFNDASANSKLLSRAPGKFNAFMQSATDNGPIENLWIDQEAMKKAGVTPDQLAIAVPSAAADIHDAMQNGQPFRVPAADFFTGAGGTDLAKALMPHFKTDPNGMSAAEAEEFMSGGGADQFKAEMDQATKTDEQKAAFEESAKAVERQIAERYKATGRFPDDVNASTARLGAFYKVLADSYGISPEEAYNRWGAQITGADMKGVAFDGTKTTPKEKATEIPKAEPVAAKVEPTGLAKVAEKVKKAIGMGKIEEPAGPKEGADIDHALNAIRMKAPKLQGEKWPLINFLVSKGGLAKDGKIAADLRDVVGERVIGLIRNEGGKGEVDNIPADELASATGLVPTTSDNGYADPKWIRDQVEREFNNAHLQDQGEDPNVSNVLAEIQKYKIDLKKTNEKIKAAILKGRLQDAKVEAAANGFNLTNEEAREVAKLRAAGYDIIDSVDEVLERRDLQAINKVAREIGHEEIEIPGDFAAPAANPDSAGAGERDRENPEDAGSGDGPSATGGSGAGVEQPPGEAGAALLDLPTDSAADIARRTADQRLKGKGPQKGLNDLDLFDENGRAIDSQKEFFQGASDVTNTPAFKKWFEDSKVVDADGKPQVVYHGTKAPIDAFNFDNAAQKIIWFTSDKSAIEAGEVGAQGRGHIEELFAKIKNPAGWDEYDKYGLDELEARGHDGVILPNKDGSFAGFVFEPSQVKSVNNRGAFNPKDERLLYQEASDPTKTPEFKKWFGESKVVDENGEPIMAYHGTREKRFTEFKITKDAPAAWFSNDEEFARSFGEPMRGVYLSIKNPYIIENEGLHHEFLYDPKEINKLKKQGYDGVIVRQKNFADSGYDVENYAIFDPTQVKSSANFGTFDPKNPNILNDKNKAAYNPDTKTIWLGKDANLSSMLHEEGHHFLNVYTALAADPDAPQRIKDIADAALKKLGVPGNTVEERVAAWRGMSIDEQRDGHEKFARGFERYLFRGQAPSIELQRAFDAFRGWLKHTYISIKNFVAMHPEAGSVNEELRGVMDRMLATDDEIEYARQVRNFGNLFTSADQAGMTPDEYRSYQNLGAQSLQDAQTELQTRSLRDMALTMRLRDKSTREFNSDARAKRKAVHDEVALEVGKEPVNQVRTFLKKGEVDGKAVGGVHKIDLDTVKRMYGEGEGALWRQLQGKFGKSGVLGNGGLHPDDVARQFGFENGDAMIREMVNQPSQAERIASMTDQRMIERYGDLKDPATIARRADQAVHNEARIRSVATELNAVRKSLGKHKILHDAAKAYAANLIARQKVGDISPGRYATAAAKASKLAMDAMAKGKLAEVAEAKRNQLVNEYATKLAYEAKDLVDKIRNNAKRYDKPGVRKRIGTDIEHIDALLDQYDMRKNAVARTDRQAARLKTWYDSQIAADYEPVISDDILNTTAKIHYADLTMDQLRGLDAGVRSIEKTARIRKEITVEGGKMALNTVVNELVGRMIERPEKFTNAQIAEPPRKGVDSLLKVGLDRMESGLRSGVAELTPIDYLANIFDNHEIEGPFHKYVFNKIWDANYWKNEQLADISRTFEEKTKELGDDWHKSLNDIVPNKVLTDNAIEQTPDAPVYRRLTRGDLIGIARNMGTESNFGKMTEGHGWDPATLWAFMRENMREQDWKAVTAEWEAFDKHWPEIEAMIRRLGGEVPQKIEARPFQTPFGEMKGGYSPIEYDPLRSKLARRLDAVSTDATKSIGQDKVFYKATTTNRSLVNRNEDYTDHVNLDYHYITRRLHETIHDLAYREALLDATKIIDHPDFRDQFMRTYGREDHQNLKKFIQNVREMYARDGAMDRYEKLIQYSRQGVIMNGIGYRLTTVLKHGSSAGLKSLGFIQGPGKKYLLARAARMASGNANEDIAKARAMFPEINARLHRMDRDFNAGEHTLYEKEGWRDKNNRFGHAMVAWSDALTAIPTAHAAYDWATTEGIPKKFGGSGKPMEHDAAVRFANSVVRQAHGSALESARSNFMHEKGLVSLLGMIYGFQNNAFGQFRDIKDKYFTEASRYQSNPALAGRVMATLVAPAVTAYLVGHGIDDRPWWKQLGQAITGELASTVPMLRDGWQMAEAAMEGRDLLHSGASLPTTQILGDIAKATVDAVKEFHGKQTRIIQDAGNAIGETFHIAGLGQLGKTLQYARDVHNGKQKPQTPLQYLKGATIGPPRKQTGAGAADEPSGGGFPTTGGVVGTPPPDAWKR